LALVGVFVLLFVIFVRPQEFMPALQALSLINVASGLALVGIIAEVATGRLKGLGTPQMPWLVGYVVWALLCTVVKVGFAPISDMKTTLLFSTIFLVLTMYSARTFEKFRALALWVMGIAILLAALTSHQGSTPFECVELEVDSDTGQVAHDRSHGEPDGRSCEDSWECNKGGKPGAEYECERTGVGGTFTVAHGRVRWRGTFADPNELSLAIGGAMSFAFAVHASMRKAIRHVLLVAVLGLAVYCVVKSGSRGGMLVLLIIFGVYFVRRFGPKGLVLGAIGGMPFLALGGRSGEDADASSLERLGALYDGVDFFKSSPIFGLGFGQFIENYFITAHNSYLLAASELGFPGLLIWSMLVYSSVKIPYAIATSKNWNLDPRIRPWALSLTASFAGMIVGIAFLSFCTHPLLFIYFGLSGALFGAARRSAPDFQVKISGKEIGVVALIDLLIITFLFVYTRAKGAP
jgi:O-antigen ligase